VAAKSPTDKSDRRPSGPRKTHFELQPLVIPEEMEVLGMAEMADTMMDLEPDPLSPHPGDRFVIDSDKPYFTPSISVISSFGSRKTSFSSTFSPSFAPSLSSSEGSTLVDSTSVLSGKTSSPTDQDLYGWEEGQEAKVRLENQLRKVSAIWPYGQKSPKALPSKGLNKPFAAIRSPVHE
jgi:hypothetical protein